MRVKTWKVLDFGTVPQKSTLHPYECICGSEAMLPMAGIPMAASGGHLDSEGRKMPEAIIFDGPGQLPAEIQCRRCRRIFTKAA